MTRPAIKGWCKRSGQDRRCRGSLVSSPWRKFCGKKGYPISLHFSIGSQTHQNWSTKTLKNLFIYLAVLGLSCNIWELLLWSTGSLAMAHGLSCSMACGILIPRTRIQPMSPTSQSRFFFFLAKQILNQWTTREVPRVHSYSTCLKSWAHTHLFIACSPCRDQTHAPYSGRPSLNHWTTKEVPPLFRFFLVILWASLTKQVWEKLVSFHLS